LLCQAGDIQRESIEKMTKDFIFLIEMEKDSLLAAGLILELKGYKVMVSGKSKSPIKKILELENSENPVNLIISDVPVSLLEKMGLIEISGKLPRKLPGILITNNTNRKTRQELENKGFHVMEKPVDPEELLRKVEEVAGASDRCRWKRPSGK
jgi:DNA-binding NtrC family response regulator